jgi:glycosyltransferase involved in cell wall biosynthesis
MVSIIYPYRNLEPERLSKSLASLSIQDDRSFEVILVDYGSDDFYSKLLIELISKYPFVKYIYSYTQYQIWSRSKALNIGIKNASFEILFTADVDMIFTPELISFLIKEYKQDVVSCFKVAYLKKKALTNFPIAEKNIISYSNSGAQGILLFSKSEAICVSCYDEFMHGWGSEDNDFVNRLLSNNLNFNFIEKIFVYHQWHQNFSSLNDLPLTSKLAVMNIQGLNSYKYHKNKALKQIAVNTNWGDVVLENDFEKLNFPTLHLNIDNKIASVDFLFYEISMVNFGIVKITVKDLNTRKYTLSNLKNIVKKKSFKNRVFYDLKHINDQLLKFLFFQNILNYSLIIDLDAKLIELVYEKKAIIL